MATKKSLHEALRNSFLSDFTEFLTARGDEVLRTKSGEIAIPCVDSEGNDEWVTITFKVPTGSRDGEPYDGYGEAESFAMHTAEKAEKAKAVAEKKAKKIEADRKAREAKAKAKAEHEAKAES